jgi:hypothetical protein
MAVEIRRLIVETLDNLLHDCDEYKQRILELEARLASLDWSEISAETLPKLGDELWRSIDADNDGISVQAVDAEMISENWTVDDYAVEYWTHFRKINAPSS